MIRAKGSKNAHKNNCFDPPVRFLIPACGCTANNAADTAETAAEIYSAPGYKAAVLEWLENCKMY
jgi:hypothetical protein